MFPVDRPTRLTFPTFDEYRMWEPMPTSQAPVQSPVEDTVSLLQRVREPLRLVMPAGGGPVGLAATGSSLAGRQLVGTLPPLFPEWLGERSFAAAHGVRFPYVAGEMANGIATTGMVTAMAGAGMLGFFGAGGLGYREVEKAVDTLAAELVGRPNWGVNLIHSPNEPDLEMRVAELLLRRGVPRISASAFMDLTPAVVLCAAHGLCRGPGGRVVRPVRLFAKVSRPEVAEKFMAPPPAAMLNALVARGKLTAEGAGLAATLPVAEDITVESDSGGHTDNRPLGSLFPVIAALAEKMRVRHGYDRPLRIGAAGGLGTPGGVAAAFALGAAYVVTGSVNQVAAEAGLSADAKALLGEADLADVVMAPAADMFELGVKLQVLRRGTLFASRAAQLYQLYRDHGGLGDITASVLAKLERDVFRMPIEDVWAETKAYWEHRDPVELGKAAVDPKHRMALLFRWYLGKSSRWAIEGDETRRADYQVWCGPAMGAFNRWTAGSFLAAPAHRTVVQIALNLLEGAAVVTRAHQVRSYGVDLPPAAFTFAPRRLA